MSIITRINKAEKRIVDLYNKLKNLPSGGGGVDSVNGQTGDVIINISGKLDKVTTNDGIKKVYIKNADGTQGMKPSSDFQDILVSGTNIKTIDGNSILGSGNLIVGGGGSDLGLLKLTDTPPPTGKHRGDVQIAGTYTNFGGIVFTQLELDNNYGYIYVNEGVSTKILSAKTTISVNGIVEEGNTQAVSGGEVYESLPKIDYENDFNLFSSSQVVENAYINTAGDVASAAGWAYAEIPVEHLTGTQEALSVSGQTMSLSNQWVFVDVNGIKLSNGAAGSVPTMANLPIPPTAVAFRLTLKRSTNGTGYLNSLMINYGAEPIDWIPYKKFIKSISDMDILANYMLKDGKVVKIEDVINNTIANNKSISLLRQGSNIYVRTSFNSISDLVRTISLTGSQNSASNLSNVKIINKEGGFLYGGELIHIQNDAVPTPFQVNAATGGGYLNIGGNHRMASVIDAIATGHDKTEDDILSIWTDGTGWEWYLVKIIDANTLRFVSKPKVEGGRDKIKRTPSSPLTHVSAATNTSNVVFTGSAYEYKPAINTITVKLYIDDVEITENGTYYGDVVKIVDTHNVCDPTQPNLVAPYLPQNNGTMVKNTLIHSFFNNGSYTVENITDWQKNHELTNAGIIQPQVINKGGYSSIMTYAMNLNMSGSLDFKNGFDLSLPISNTNVKNNDFLEPTKAVQQLSEILFNGSDPIVGCGFGYNPLVGLGKQDSLLQNENHLLFASSKKYYPYAYSLRETQTNILHGIGYYAYWDATVNPNLSADYFVPFGDSFLYFLNLRTASTKLRITLSKELLLKEFEVVNSSDNIVLHTENSTTSEGLIVSGSVGDWCILKIR